MNDLIKRVRGKISKTAYDLGILDPKNTPTFAKQVYTEAANALIAMIREGWVEAVPTDQSDIEQARDLTDEEITSIACQTWEFTRLDHAFGEKIRRFARQIVERSYSDFTAMEKRIEELEHLLDSQKRATEVAMHDNAAMKERVKELELPLCIGEPTIRILAEMGRAEFSHHAPLIAADGLMGNNPYVKLADQDEAISRLKSSYQKAVAEIGKLKAELATAEDAKEKRLCELLKQLNNADSRSPGNHAAELASDGSGHIEDVWCRTLAFWGSEAGLSGAIAALERLIAEKQPPKPTDAEAIVCGLRKQLA